MSQSGANPLFERFLKELQREAQASHSDRLVLNYRKAIRSFQKYPAPLYSGEQAMVLDGVGKFIAKKLADKFEEYRHKHPEATFEPDPHGRQPFVPVTPAKKGAKRKRADTEEQENRADPNVPVESRAGSSETRDQTDEPKPKKKRTTKAKSAEGAESVPKSKPVKQYVPKVRSGAWALLLALYRHSLLAPSESALGLNKTALIARAAPLADASFDPPPGGMPYNATAWGGMATLEKHVLVSRDGRPARYSLTVQGRALAEQLHALTPDVDTWRDSAEWQETRVKPVTAQPSVTRVNHLLADLQQFERAQSQGRSLTSDDTCQSAALTEHVIEEVLLVLDNREIKNQKERSYLHDQLVKEGVACQVRKLELGDVVWLGRTARGVEVVLDHIIERKQIPDLCASIIDGRYKEQKFRLRRCGVRDVLYLVEGDINGYFQRPRPGVKKESVLTALTSTAVSDGLRVVQTQTASETVKFLARMTRVLTARHVGSHVHTTESDRLLQNKLKGQSQSLTTLHLTFEQFSECNTKSRDLTLTDLFAKQLMTLNGCSEDKAAAITAKYSSPLALIQAYNALSSDQQRADLLKDLKGPASSKKLGPVLSRLICETYCTEH
jgi:crossover junction endonuclease MUS81